MLEHEAPDTKTATPPPVTPPSVTSAAERRVSPEELTAALNALEASKQQAAKQLAETVPIGQVVSEMGLEATPEEIWAQVQAQRAQKSAKEQAAEEANQIPFQRFLGSGWSRRPRGSNTSEDANQIPFEQAAKQAYRQRTPAVSPLPVLPTLPRLPRPLLRRLSKVKGWVWILFWCTGGFGLISGLSHSHSPAVSITNSGQTITIDGDIGTETVTVPAEGKDVVVSGDSNKIALQGKARSVTVTGDFNTVRGETPQKSHVTGDGDTVLWIDTPTPPTR